MSAAFNTAPRSRHDTAPQRREKFKLLVVPDQILDIDHAALRDYTRAREAGLSEEIAQDGLPVRTLKQARLAEDIESHPVQTIRLLVVATQVAVFAVVVGKEEPCRRLVQP